MRLSSLSASNAKPQMRSGSRSPVPATSMRGGAGSGSTSVLGYMGVTVWNPAGRLLGRIRLPEGCANVCFGGPKRDHLFMTASQSLYMLKVNIQGAAPG